MQVPLCCGDDTQNKKYNVKVNKSHKRCYQMTYDCQMAQEIGTQIKSQTEAISLSWALKYGRTQLVEKKEEELAERQKCHFPFFLPLLFPPFSVPKLEITEKHLRMKMIIGDVLFQGYKKQ